MKAAVYKHFAANGELLYVGFSLNPFVRNQCHGSGASWWMEVASISIDWYSTKEDAMTAERLAIKIECPRENVKDMPDGLFKKRTPRMRNVTPPPSETPHAQLDALENEFNIYPSSWPYQAACMKIGKQNEIRNSGRELLSSEVGALRRALNTTFKRLEAIGIHRRNVG